MTLDEAIKHLRIYMSSRWSPTDLDWRAAMILAMDALYRIKEQRKFPDYARTGLLPGETED